MSDKYYVDEDYISEILILLKAWIDTDKNIAIKKVLYKNNSLLFFKNPNANFAAYVKLGENMLGRRIHTVDVSELTGEYYICTHGFSQKYDILSVQLI